MQINSHVFVGCKWSLRQLRCYLRQTIRSDWLLWQNIATMIVLTLASQLSRVPHTNNCFELYGFDVLIDGALKPWLIEVNSSPALSVDCEIDVEIKKPMIHDLFDLLGLPIRNIDLLTPSTKCWPKRENCRYSNSLMRAVSKWKKKQTKTVAAVRVQKNKENQFRVWGNGKNWNHPETKVGNWVCVFPILASHHQQWTAKRATPVNNSEIRRTFSTEEIRSVVCSATLFQKLAKDTFEQHFDAEIDELNLFMSKYLRVDSQLWFPPL